MRLEGIKSISYSPLPARVLCCAAGSAAFSFLFGGGPLDSLVAFFCGVVLELYLDFADRKGMSKFLKNLSSSALNPPQAKAGTQLVDTQQRPQDKQAAGGGNPGALRVGKTALADNLRLIDGKDINAQAHHSEQGQRTPKADQPRTD